MSGKPSKTVKTPVERAPIYLRWWFILLIAFTILVLVVNLAPIYYKQLRAAGHVFYEEGAWAYRGRTVKYYWFFRVGEPVEVVAYMTGGENVFWLYRLGPETPRVEGLAPIEYEEKGAELILWKDGAFKDVGLRLDPGEYLIIVFTDKNAPWDYTFTVGLKRV
jgi:hypothetical protein